MTSRWQVVPLHPEHLHELLWVDHSAFVAVQDPDDTYDHFEWDRAIGVRAADGQLVGAALTFSLRVSVPDRGLSPDTRAVPLAGLSWVGVHPGYRRQGVLSALVRDHLHQLHEQHGEALSGLNASQAGIYGRFGYGLASTGYSVNLGHDVGLRDIPGGGDLTVRFLDADPDRHVDLIADLHTRGCRLRPGMVDRTPALTRVELHQTPRSRQQHEPVRLVLTERDGQPTGYALLRRTSRWSDGLPDGSTEVLELIGLDPASEHRLVRTVTQFDLTTSTLLHRIATDHPLLSWLVDPRSAQPRLHDKLWLRVVDVDRALTARGYALDVDLVLAVTDAGCPWNARRWRLVTGPDGAACTPTTAPADLSLDVRELAGTLAGGGPLAALARAGLVQEHRPGAVARLSAALRSAIAPATTYGF